MNVLTFLLSALFVLTCLFLIFVVLIQKGEGGGLGGLAGGGVDTAFGAKADMTWKRATFVAALLFVVLSLMLGVLKRPRSVTKVVQNPPPAAPLPPPAPSIPLPPNPPAHVGS